MWKFGRNIHNRKFERTYIISFKNILKVKAVGWHKALVKLTNKWGWILTWNFDKVIVITPANEEITMTWDHDTKRWSYEPEWAKDVK